MTGAIYFAPKGAWVCGGWHFYPDLSVGTTNISPLTGFEGRKREGLEGWEVLVVGYSTKVWEDGEEGISVISYQLSVINYEVSGAKLQTSHNKFELRCQIV